MGRVEPRPGLVGTGMGADPEKIRELQEEASRQERARRKKPKKPFRKVMREKQLKSEGYE
ncbi:MAG: hypothetical protein JKY15_00670 [Deltaproteobacteria bacterium]|nr:hypothetical protein [Deltaproteobacteria bacterium]